LTDFEDYSLKGRTYRFMSDPLFQFGFGLSYTSFKIGQAKLDRTEISNTESCKLTVPVINTGKRKGTEVVQVYIRRVDDTDGPTRTLRGFQRVEVAPGKSNLSVIDLPYNSFEFFDRTIGGMTVTPGAYEIFYGNSSDVKDLQTVRVTIKGL
jgi:beta-glucosidase